MIDLENEPALQKFKIQFQGVQEIYNLACPMSPKNFKENIPSILMANCYVIKNILDLAGQYESKLVHFSSSVVYGPRKDKNSKIREEDIGVVDFLSERGAYDEGKRFAETMIKNYRDAYNTDVKIARVFRTYGPRMPLDDNQMIPDFIRDAIDSKDVIIYGDETFHSGFCYVMDVVDGVIKFASTDLAGPVNIGSDVDVSLTEIANKIIDKLDSSSKVVYEEPHLFMTPLGLPDIEKASNQLGWMPVTTLDKGLELTIEDLRASKGLRNIKSIVSDL